MSISENIENIVLDMLLPTSKPITVGIIINWIDAEYIDLTTASQVIVNEISPMKDIWVKGNSKPWFHSDIMETILVFEANTQ